jgi:predicted nucleotidyltransferase
MDISSLFKSKTRNKLFQLYFSAPEKEYYLRELERLLEIPVSMIRGELKRQEESGVFVSKKKANLVYYSLNKSYPLYEEIKSIVRKTIGVETLLKQSIDKTKGVDLAFIYGSYAKQQDKSNSDIDLCIVGDLDEDQLIRDISRLENSLQREIQYTHYKKTEYIREKTTPGSFLNMVLKEKIILLKGDIDARKID